MSSDGAGASGATTEHSVDTTSLPSLEAEGALLSVKISRDGKRLFANVRPFVDQEYFRQFARRSTPRNSVWHPAAAALAAIARARLAPTDQSRGPREAGPPHDRCQPQPLHWAATLGRPSMSAVAPLRGVAAACVPVPSGACRNYADFDAP